MHMAHQLGILDKTVIESLIETVFKFMFFPSICPRFGSLTIIARITASKIPTTPKM